VVAIGILAVAALLEGYSFHTVLEQSKRLKGTDGWWEFIRNSRVPEPPVVLLEDSAALIGLGLAFAGVTLTAKVVCGPEHEFATAAGVIRNAEARIRQSMPSVRVVYIQPDIQPGTPEN
jgi:hypothetical protein